MTDTEVNTYRCTCCPVTETTVSTKPGVGMTPKVDHREARIWAEASLMWVVHTDMARLVNVARAYAALDDELELARNVVEAARALLDKGIDANDCPLIDLGEALEALDRKLRE